MNDDQREIRMRIFSTAQRGGEKVSDFFFLVSNFVKTGKNLIVFHSMRLCPDLGMLFYCMMIP